MKEHFPKSNKNNYNGPRKKNQTSFMKSKVAGEVKLAYLGLMANKE